MQDPDEPALDKLLFDCCHDLFAAYALDVHPVGRQDFHAEEALSMCGVMGFGGKQMRGALVLATTREPLEQTNPEGIGSQRDWVCELSNQLMGRVKNRLLASGVEIHLATPAGLSGHNLLPMPRKPRTQVFAAGQGFVCVWIDFELAEGFELRLAPTPEREAAVREGETLLF